jgi:hypothetical protein
MATTAMVDSYVRHLLHEERGDDVEVVGGHYVLAGPHPVHVWVIGDNHRTRRVLVTAEVLGDVEDVDDDHDVLEALNELNAVTMYGRFFVADGTVRVEDTVLADVLDPASLFNSIGFVTWVAETQAEQLRERLGLGAGAVAAGTGDDGGEVALDAHAGLDLVEHGRQEQDPARSEVIVAGGYL